MYVMHPLYYNKALPISRWLHSFLLFIILLVWYMIVIHSYNLQESYGKLNRISYMVWNGART